MEIKLTIPAKYIDVPSCAPDWIMDAGSRAVENVAV